MSGSAASALIDSTAAVIPIGGDLDFRNAGLRPGDHLRCRRPTPALSANFSSSARHSTSRPRIRHNICQPFRNVVAFGLSGSRTTLTTGLGLKPREDHRRRFPRASRRPRRCPGRYRPSCPPMATSPSSGPTCYRDWRSWHQARDARARSQHFSPSSQTHTVVAATRSSR